MPKSSRPSAGSIVITPQQIADIEARAKAMMKDTQALKDYTLERSFVHLQVLDLAGMQYPRAAKTFIDLAARLRETVAKTTEETPGQSTSKPGENKGLRGAKEGPDLGKPARVKRKPASKAQGRRQDGEGEGPAS